ncbi:hypothetical protein KIW84_043084 [Lathyrus oleraceus]|uniref:Uncharacterized protein n=1 Tax=Pisum sativum TaxID=3888 RepID=A0A9D5ATZ2_PEA|nr:hypothetical protein KIW84_043084 [Pisum sativum]
MAQFRPESSASESEGLVQDFRINDNSFNGKIPSFIQNWKQLQRLEMHASGLEGPIPSNISLLTNLSRLRISDINGPSQDFSILSSMTGMIRVVQRNCNITGEIPSYFWTMKDLDMLDLSFNNLFGEIPAKAHVGHLRFLFLTGNKLSGGTPELTQACYAILVLILPAGEPRFWSNQELEIIKMVADQVAVALSHAAILEESQLMREKLEERNRALQQARRNTMMASQTMPTEGTSFNSLSLTCNRNTGSWYS